MCIGIPMQLISTEGELALAEAGGVRRRISLALIGEEVLPGDFVIVHVGYAIEKVREEEARETLALFEEVLADGGGDGRA
jgi:hydrogenase expression/formation protein HypC